MNVKCGKFEYLFINLKFAFLCPEFFERLNAAHFRALLLGHWYEIMALYYVKSILTKILASRQEGFCKKSKIIRISEHIGHATDV